MALHFQSRYSLIIKTSLQTQLTTSMLDVRPLRFWPETYPCPLKRPFCPWCFFLTTRPHPKLNNDNEGVTLLPQSLFVSLNDYHDWQYMSLTSICSSMAGVLPSDKTETWFTTMYGLSAVMVPSTCLQSPFDLVLPQFGLAIFNKVKISQDGLLQMLRSKIWPINFLSCRSTQII